MVSEEIHRMQDRKPFKNDICTLYFVRRVEELYVCALMVFLALLITINVQRFVQAQVRTTCVANLRDSQIK